MYSLKSCCSFFLFQAKKIEPENLCTFFKETAIKTFGL